MALHFLCDQLRRIGRDAYIWPAGVPAVRPNEAAFTLPSDPPQRIPLNVSFRQNPAFDTALAAPEDLAKAIVVYPEVIFGNPLNSDRVVRWFLNKPGLLTGHARFSENDLFFYYQEAFDDPTINPHRGNKLQVITILDSIFKQVLPTSGRSGTCYILRKGKDRAPQPNELDGPVIDGRSHEEIADIFNRHEYCVSFDTRTMYSVYAAMCGCKSIIVPEFGIEKHVWQPVTELTYGVAYGFDDLEWASDTKQLMIEYYQKIQSENLGSVEFFSQVCERAFPF